MQGNLLTQEYIQAIETELQEVVSKAGGADLDVFKHMLAYHMGWEGEGSGRKATGKRIRPLLLLLTCSAAGGNWENALPAAAAVELIHNFSLLHDDIEDNSPLRRGRPTVWSKWGIPQALNTGDGMFTLAHLAMLKIKDTTDSQTVITAEFILHNTCLRLTQGQYLDIAFESRNEISLDSYWAMIEGKTAALFSACTQIGALIAKTSESTRENYRRYGHFLGLSFQIIDDILGIWGDAVLTGKPAESDMVSGKKTLPILYGISQKGTFASRWTKGRITPEEVPFLARQLEAEGALHFSENEASRLTQNAKEALEQAHPSGIAEETLISLTNYLFDRKR